MLNPLETVKTSVTLNELMKKDKAELVTIITHLSNKAEDLFSDVQYYRGLTEGYNRIFNKLRVDTKIAPKIARSRKK